MLTRLQQLLHKVEESLISLLLVGMTLLVFVEVVLRFAFNTGLHWIEELTLHTAAWFVLFGVSYGVKVGAHIGVDVFVKLCPSPLRRVLGLTAVLASLAYCVLLLIGSWEYLQLMQLIGIEMEDLPVPKWVAMSILVFGLGLLALRFLQLLWAIVTGRAEGFHLADETKESLELARELNAPMQTAEKQVAEKKSTAPGMGATTELQSAEAH